MLESNIQWMLKAEDSNGQKCCIDLLVFDCHTLQRNSLQQGNTWDPTWKAYELK